MNDISKAYQDSEIALYGNNTEMHSSSKDVAVAVDKINDDLKRINKWFCDNGLICNTKKTETMVIASQKTVKTTRHLNIFYGDSTLNQKRSFKHLGVIADESLSWNSHISYIASRVYPTVKLLNRFLSFLGPAVLFEDIYSDNFTHLRLRFYHMGILHQEEIWFFRMVTE